MTDLTSFLVADNVSFPQAQDANRSLASALRAEMSNATTMSGTVALIDNDVPTQRFNCNGANRIVTLPAYATSNHAYIIINVTAATYTLDVQSSGGVSLLSTPLVANGGIAFIVPDGTAGFKAIQSNGVVWGAITGSISNQTDLKYLTTPEQGTLMNGKINVTVASNNLTLALKTQAGNDPSASEPVYIYIGGAWRQVTAALSVTAAAATNWFNAGSAELATQEIDYFAYLGYNATDGIVIGFSRIPFGYKYSDFNTTSTNEQYCKISTITNAAANDEYVIVGRFAATLSAGAGYTWTVPTYTPLNLIQRPIFESRWSVWVPSIVGFSANPSNVVYTYKTSLHNVVSNFAEGANGTSNSTSKTYTLPFTATARTNAAFAVATGVIVDNGSPVANGALVLLGGSNIANAYKSAAIAWTTSGGCRPIGSAVQLQFEI